MAWNLGHRAGQRLKGKKDAGCREGHVETSEQNRRIVNPCDHEETGTQQGHGCGRPQPEPRGGSCFPPPFQ